MNIKRAKEEIKNSIEAYLMKNEFGEYQIPSVRQRPLLLIGPPGIGKTQIMEQIAKECQVGLVAYTITHHTRQSAIGLPYIVEKKFQGEKVSVTEYTMSEIIASVYEKIEKTGIHEGILFIDEINCVSETLAPTMLQFLQCKTFGNQKVPEGWVIVAAGNPPEYNKSVRDFDVVTLDRIKKIDVAADFLVWKEYAYHAGIHQAVLSYLELKKNHFYCIETTVDGKLFATARGWEDLSQLIQVYEAIGKRIDREVVYQYIQHWKIAKDFSNYLELYQKYKKDYQVADILDGHISQTAIDKVRRASFDEKLSVIGLLVSRLDELFRTCYRSDSFVTMVYEQLKSFKSMLNISDQSKGNIAVNESGNTGANGAYAAMAETARKVEEETARLLSAEQLTKEQEHIRRKVAAQLEAYENMLKAGTYMDNLEAFEAVKERFADITDSRSTSFKEAEEALNYAFDFMEAAFGDSQEMVIFITELNTDFYSVWFVDENGCDRYYKYNKTLLFAEKQKGIIHQLDEIEEMLNI